MAHWTRTRLSFANVVSLIAVFVALGGTGYAAVKLPKNSVGSTQIKSNAVSSGKVKNGSLRKVDFKAGELPAGAPGPKGDKGDRGTNGTNGVNGTDGPSGQATAYARVQASGALETGTATGSGPAQFKGVDATDIQHPSAGVYCFGELGFDIASAVVSMDNAGAATTTTEVASVAIQRGANLNGCDAAHQQARVVVTNVDPALANEAVVDGRFTVWFEK